MRPSQLVVAAAALLASSCAAEVVPELDVSVKRAPLVVGEAAPIRVARRFPGGAFEDVTARVTFVSSQRDVADVVADGAARLLVAGGAPGAALVRVIDPETDAASAVDVTVVAP